MKKTTLWCAVTTALVGTALAVTAGAAYSAPAPAPARVTGTAEFALPYWPDDDVRSFAFDARAAPYSRPLPGLPGGSPADATGTVRVAHRLAQDGRTVTFEAAVDCLITSPGAATLTAVVTRADEPVRDWVGKRVGFSVRDGGHDRRGHSRDRVGFSWAFSADQSDAGEWGPARVGTCVAPAAFSPVTSGDYTVRHADLTAPPAGG
ncbi:hypothetical protein [Actinoplanes sp. NPDC049118]|uniref:hypothetical protein n=1 Tax=Actinoplanes sp. NPDC049118 TaxID=3155769 RepID=UPI0033F0B50C